MASSDLSTLPPHNVGLKPEGEALRRSVGSLPLRASGAPVRHRPVVSDVAAVLTVQSLPMYLVQPGLVPGVAGHDPLPTPFSIWHVVVDGVVGVIHGAIPLERLDLLAASADIWLISHGGH